MCRAEGEARRGRSAHRCLKSSAACTGNAKTPYPIESQLWNLCKGERPGTTSWRECGSTGPQAVGEPSADSVGCRPRACRAVLAAFDGAVVPTYRATVVNWTAPDGKSIDAFTASRPRPTRPRRSSISSTAASVHQSGAPRRSPSCTDEPANPLYEDWLALSRLGPVSANGRPFRSTSATPWPGSVGQTNPDEFFPDYLEERTTAHRPDPVSGSRPTPAERRRLDAAWAESRRLPQPCAPARPRRRSG